LGILFSSILCTCPNQRNVCSLIVSALLVILEVPFATYIHLTSWWWAVDARNLYRYLNSIS
jgi:hypothetical protein